jgi:protein TonB
MKTTTLPEKNSMSVTVNSFPSLHSFDSPRGWALAIIVLIHLLFFWALTSGMAVRIIEAVHGPSKMVPVAAVRPIEPPQPIELHPIVDDFFVPPVEGPVAPTSDEDTGIQIATPIDRPPTDYIEPTRGVEPVVVEPAIDPKRQLAEPTYVAQEVRLGHAGTVLLSVLVLENGRVGEVRIDQSSGYERLDESAAHTAKRWQFKPGMKDGVPVQMWKRVPITFQLK